MKPSGIRKFFDMLQGREDVVGLTVGQPDFVTPWHIREAGIDSLKEGKTYYTSNAGLIELRVEIANYLRRRFSLGYNGETEVVVTVGGSEAIDIAVRACVEAGDEVIIPSPCFVCYEPCVRLAGGVPVILETKAKNNFKVDPEELKALITSKTKMLILAYPNNPTGAILTKEELEDIADVIRDTNIVVLSDEIYSELTYGRKHTSLANIEGMHERTILASGFSKSYAMTGWRMGYIAAPEPLAKQMLKLHQYVIMCAPTTSQFAALEAVKNGDDDIEKMKEEYDRRRKYLLKGFNRIGIECFEPEGAFYAFPNIGKFGLSSEKFCERLLEENKCAIVPGTAFGKSGEGFARISYAYSIKHIDQALDRIEDFVKRL
ncbi:MAG: aminotransferase class I/II-fold pyridoxal phosphate-dependent enzyme, partial [Clostridia bacterium]|nr:aminotransferase class I/II-fold pyridoxal phosphate-dependent enzyme [Clostridia bacterium]